MFLKFKAETECEAAIRTLREARLKFGAQEVWAKLEMPLPMRTLNSLLFATKRMMINWGVYDKRAIWVDKDEQVLKVGFETIMTPTVDSGKLHVNFGEGWATEINGDEFKKIRDEAEQELRSDMVPTTGVGKGKQDKSE